MGCWRDSVCKAFVESGVGGFEVEEELAGLLLVKFLAGLHAVERGNPCTQLDLALKVRREVGSLLRLSRRSVSSGKSESTAVMLSLSESIAVMKCCTVCATTRASGFEASPPAPAPPSTWCSTVAGIPLFSRLSAAGQSSLYSAANWSTSISTSPRAVRNCAISLVHAGPYSAALTASFTYAFSRCSVVLMIA